MLERSVNMENAEETRLRNSWARTEHWKRWGPYVAERAWGTVREDYSSDGNAWQYFPHDMARSRAFRWNEDGLAGFCDRHQKICFALSLWNGHDTILKERLFGLSGCEGNHGEDVKEQYFYLDSTPTHSYTKFLYKYPHSAFPYETLVSINRNRDKDQPEYELMDTGVFDENRYFDVLVEYAKGSVEDILARITIINNGPESAEISVLPTVWFRNTWAWGTGVDRPQLNTSKHNALIDLSEPAYGERLLYGTSPDETLFTENNTNHRRLSGFPDIAGYFKDGINDYIVNGCVESVNPDKVGTKASVHYHRVLKPNQTLVLKLRLRDELILDVGSDGVGVDFDSIFAERIREADVFYDKIIRQDLSHDARNVMRQAFAGLLWSKQFYHYVTKQWIDGDPNTDTPAASRRHGRNHDWLHLYNADVISMPDKWEYPWYAAWDLAFHCIPLSMVDPEFAKDQLMLMVREWYMHPNGELPAYEWALGDVNPPVHAWATLRVFQIEEKATGKPDLGFLERVFHKLLMNFTWWVNRKDANGMNVFQGGFLGLDNIGVFDRSAPLPTGGFLEQSDGTSWMAMYTLNLLAISMELAQYNPSYEDVASKFWEHFLHIVSAMNGQGREGAALWDNEDGFFYDVLNEPDGTRHALKIRSMVGLIPLFAVQTLERALMDRMPGFKRRMAWFIENRPELVKNIADSSTPGAEDRLLLSAVNESQLRRVLKVMLDEDEFLSPYGLRALSKFHKTNPFVVTVEGQEHRVDYEPAESSTGLFGGNSNWRGPIWFPLNYLMIESLQKYHYYYGDTVRVECPTRSGIMMNLAEVAAELSQRLARLFLTDEHGKRPTNGTNEQFQTDPRWQNLVLFHEFFDGDTGKGLGASHQTGWTGLVAKLLQQSGENQANAVPKPH